MKNDDVNIEETNLNMSYRYENLIITEHNQFAHAASLAVAEYPGEIYNPFYIYGATSVDKTFMLQAIGNYVVENHPEKKVYYTTGQMIVEEIDEALQKQGTTIKEFRNKYRAIEVLLIDDIQFMIGKECIQMGFLEIVEYMIAHGKQIVVSCDRPLNDRNPFSEKLKNCFASGLVTWLIQDTDTVGQVLEVVARYYRITSEDLIGDVRQSEILTPRFVAMYLMCEVKKISLSEICRKMNRNFENISYGVETIKQEIVKDSELKESIDELGQMIR